MRGNEREIVLSPRNCKWVRVSTGKAVGPYLIYGGVPKGGGLLYHGPNPYWSLAT